MEDVQIKLSALWIATMLTYLLGDVLRVYAGDYEPGQMGGVPVGENLFLVAAVVQLLPILMVVLSVTLPYPANRWVNVVVAVAFFAFNLIGLPTYPGTYDKFLIAVSLWFNALVAWYAWEWV